MFSLELIIALLVLVILWLIFLTILLVRSLVRYARLTKNSRGEDLTAIWEAYLKKARENESQITTLKSQILNLEKQEVKNFQRVGIVRFNPFNDAGGNQSFALSLLDGDGNGMVLSSLHGRELTRTYAKPVKNFGPSDFEFSKEEEEAILQARNGKH